MRWPGSGATTSVPDRAQEVLRIQREAIALTREIREELDRLDRTLLRQSAVTIVEGKNDE